MESSHPFDQILQALMEGIVVEDRAGQIVFVNRALEQLLGYEREELIGLHWTELIPAELREGAAGRRTAGMGEGSASFETCLQRKDGTRTRVLVRMKPLFSGKRPQGLLSAFFPLKDTDVNALIRHTLEVQSPALKDSVQMVANLAADLPTTRADPDRLQQIFVNVIHNACQAIAESRNGTGGATPKAGRVMITTALVHNRNGHRPQIQIRFADNGTGIGPDVMPHLFEPFFTTRRAGGGIGLGLSICDRIAREHGGRIWAENNSEGGATFVLCPGTAPD